MAPISRSSTTLFRLSRGVLVIRGEDRVRFLNGMITHDVKALASGQGKYALLCNEKGKILTDLYVWAFPEEFAVEIQASLVEKVRSTLDRYIIADDVEMEDQTAQWVLFHLAGKDATKILSALGISEPAEMVLASMKIAGKDVQAAKNPRLGLLGFDLWCAPADAEIVQEAILKAGAALGDEQTFDALQMESGIPKYGVDFTDENLPQEANLQHAFSRTKGCYIGQEVICKIESFAHVNKHLTGFVLEDGIVPPPGAKIFSGGKEAGVLTRTVLSPTLGKPIAFGYVRDKAREEGADLSAAEIRWEGGSAKAREKPGAFVS